MVWPEPVQAATHRGVYVTIAELLALRKFRARSKGKNRQVVQNALPGDSQSRMRGRGIEFVEMRPYQAGDDIRTIDWRLSARTGKPFTKLYVEEREKPSFIVVDQRINMFFGSSNTFKSVVAARLCAMIAWHAQAQGDRLGGMVAGESILRVRSSTTRRSTLRFLQLVTDANCALNAHAQNQLSLDQMMRDALLQTSIGTSVIFISDFHDVDRQSLQSLMALARKRQLLLIKVSDPMETFLPKVGTVGIGNGIDASRIVVGKYQQQRIMQSRAIEMQRLLECVEQCSAKLFAVSTEDALSPVLDRYARYRL